MQRIFFPCLALLLFYGCKKDNGAPIEIYELKSFTATINTGAAHPAISISNAVLADAPLVGDQDIDSYETSTSTFKLKKDINPVIHNYNHDKAFAVVVDAQPVYFGLFHPGILNSMDVGIATIDPIISNNNVSIGFITMTGNTAITQLDKRNDNQILIALRASGRLR